MKIGSLIVAGLLLVTFAGMQPALAQSGCADVNFSSSITDRFPEAENACRGIISKEGQAFTHFQAEIVSVSGNNVRAKFRLPDGSYSETYAFDMESSDRVQIGGRSYRYRELGRGQELDIYVPSDRWEFHIPEEEDFVVSRTVAVAVPYVAEEETALPQTASPLPLIGMMGGMLTLVGLGLVAIRRRLST